MPKLKPRPQKLRCESQTVRGQPCQGWALRGETVCLLHSMSEEERATFTRRGSERSIIVRRASAEARRTGSLKHHPDAVSLALCMQAMQQLLQGRVEGVAPLVQKAIGIELVAAVFRQPDREAAFELLNRRSPQIAAGLDLDALKRFDGARKRLLDQVKSGEVEVGELSDVVRELLNAKP